MHRLSICFHTSTNSSEKSLSHRNFTCLNQGEFSSLDSQHHHQIDAIQLLFREREREKGNFMLNNENRFLFETLFRWRILSHNAREIQILFSGTADVERSNSTSLMQMTHNRNLMVFPPSWTVSDAIKLEITAFFGWCKNGRHVQFRGIICWIKFELQPVTSCLLCSRCRLEPQQGEAAKCSRNNQTTATKRWSEMLRGVSFVVVKSLAWLMAVENRKGNCS